MSVITARSSILKKYIAHSRDRVKSNVHNKVRFDLLNNKSLRKLLQDVAAQQNFREYDDYIRMLRETDLSETDFISTLQDARECVELLKPVYVDFVEALISINWLQYGKEAAILEYQTFLIDLLSAHSRYTQFAVQCLITRLIPLESEQHQWPLGRPVAEKSAQMSRIYETLNAIIEVIPLAHNLLIEAVAKKYPYYSLPANVIGGFVYNLFALMQERPQIVDDLFPLMLRKYLVLDVNTPRNDIEDAEYESDADEEMFDMDVENQTMNGNVVKHSFEEDEMKLPTAETLDICMEHLFQFIEIEHKNESKPSTSTQESTSIFKLLMKIFDHLLLPTHNSHHVQFALFYYCSFKISLAEKFLSFCWQKTRELNSPFSIRQAAVGYLASLLSRSKILSVKYVKEYLDLMCTWIHEYIQRCDYNQNSHNPKAHIVFFATCQAVFYLISFRSRDLTANPENLLFLQNLQLNTIVTCHLNPLKVCLPTVATAFSGVTRAHQLAYCQTILERNARKKLATIYSSNTPTLPQQCLETFFPFDHYILKKSGKRIAKIYRDYQASDAEEGQCINNLRDGVNGGSGGGGVGVDCIATNKRRKHLESVTEDIDDFIVDKRLKIVELSRSFDRELQFNNISTTPKFC